MTTLTRRGGTAVAALACAGMLLAGCSTGATGEGTANGEVSTAQSEAVTITITNPLNLNTLPLYIGIEEGFFEEEGLTIEAGQTIGSGSTIEAVIGGQVDMAWTSVSGALLPFAQGIPLRLVAVSEIGTPGVLELLVKGDSLYQELADLQGKNVAVLSPATGCMWQIKSALEAEGLDPESITLDIIAPREHPVVLDSGQVAAACTTDPLKTVMIEQFGARAIWDGEVDGVSELQGLPSGGYFVSADYASNNPDAVAAFQRAIAKAAAWANEHEAEVRAMLPDLLEVDAALIDKVFIPRFSEETGAAEYTGQIETIADALYRTKLTDSLIGIEGFVEQD